MRWSEATAHTHQDEERRRRTQMTEEEDSYKPWSDFGGQRPPPSCHFSHLRWDGERPSLKEDKSPGQHRERRAYTKTEKKKQRTQKFRLLGANWKKDKGELLIVLILIGKKSVYLIIQSKETVQEVTQTLQWKPLVTQNSDTPPPNHPNTHSHTHTHTHTRKHVHVDKAAAEKK